MLDVIIMVYKIVPTICLYRPSYSACNPLYQKYDIANESDNNEITTTNNVMKVFVTHNPDAYIPVCD